MPGTVSTILPPAPGGKRARPMLFLGLQCDRPFAPAARWSLTGLDVVRLGRGDAHDARRDNAGALVIFLPDTRTSTAHALLSRLGNRWVLEDARSKNGTRKNGVEVDRAVLEDGDLIEIGHTFLCFRDGRDGAGCDDDVGGDPAAAAPGLATLWPPLERELAGLARAAASGVPVILGGESGTGKELAARAVHVLSGRTGRFVPINCGGLPQELVESELYGHKKGAFSGAVADRPGLARSADGGTLFLDEIADLPEPSQAAFLRLLQEGEITPLGSAQPVRVDARLVSATHGDLRALVDAGRFRADLLARLSGLSFTLPPLRERLVDLPLLVAALLAKAPGAPREVTFSVEAARALYRYGWPLNVRELERALAGAVVLAAGGRIELAHLPAAVRDPAPSPTSAIPASADDERLRRDLTECLQRHGGNVSAVAREMAKDRKQIHRWIKRFGLQGE